VITESGRRLLVLQVPESRQSRRQWRPQQPGHHDGNTGTPAGVRVGARPMSAAMSVPSPRGTGSTSTNISSKPPLRCDLDSDRPSVALPHWCAHAGSRHRDRDCDCDCDCDSDSDSEFPSPPPTDVGIEGRPGPRSTPRGLDSDMIHMKARARLGAARSVLHKCSPEDH
jgi:hypothetical protein